MSNVPEGTSSDGKNTVVKHPNLSPSGSDERHTVAKALNIAENTKFTLINL